MNAADQPEAEHAFVPPIGRLALYAPRTAQCPTPCLCGVAPIAKPHPPSAAGLSGLKCQTAAEVVLEPEPPAVHRAGWGFHLALFAVAIASSFNGFLVGTAISGLGFGMYVAVNLALVSRARQGHRHRRRGSLRGGAGEMTVA